MKVRVRRLCAGSLLLLGCSFNSYPSADGGSGADGRVPLGDAGPPLDAPGWSSDGADGPDAFDAGGGVEAGAADAGCLCESTSPCEVSECRGGVCIREAALDGVVCSEGEHHQICVAGLCVDRGCGDGYREPGPDPAREGCDDGNAVDHDGCSALCVPQQAVLEGRAEGRDEPIGPARAIGIDGAGRALVVWTAEVAGGVELRARRLTAGGALADTGESILIASSFYGIPAAVTGLLGGGWVVTWSAPLVDGDMEGVAFRRVEVDGRLGPVRVASEETFLNQSRPSITALEDGFAIAWNDQSRLVGAGPALRVRARRFAADGRALSVEFSLSSGASAAHQDPVLTAVGSTLFAAWVAQTADSTSVRARRFGSSGPLDAGDLVVAATRASEPTVAALASGDFAVVWRDRNVDPYGDIWAARISSSSDVVLEPFPLTASPPPYDMHSADLAPSVAPVGDGFLVVHQRYRAERGLGLVAAVDPPPPELDRLQELLSDETAGHAAVASGPRGVWALWSTGTDPSAVGAWRSVVAFLMAAD